MLWLWLKGFAEQFRYADTYGSLMEVSGSENIEGIISDYSPTFGMSVSQLEMMMKIYRILSQKYDVVCTNPPYMGSSGMNEDLSKFVKNKFPDSKSDLFACFIEKCGHLIKPNGFYAMITQHAWMFLSSYENLRKKLMFKSTVNMAHLGARAFDEIGGEVVQTTAFVDCGRKFSDYMGTYARLVDVIGENEKRDLFLTGEKRYTAKQENFSKIPGMPVAYWVSDRFTNAITNPKLESIISLVEGVHSRNNEEFLRLWYEVPFYKSSLYSFNKNKKWFPYSKGGNFRLWYGNNEYVVNWENNGEAIRKFPKSSIGKSSHFFEEGITLTIVTSARNSFRYAPNGFLYDVSGPTIYSKQKNLMYLLGMLNSKFIYLVLRIYNPTISIQMGDIKKLPIIIDENRKEEVEFLVKENIEMSKQDWDSFETSWDFERHPLVCGTSSIKEAYKKWEQECEQRFNKLKVNEEELNRIFIDIYGLQDELTPEVEDKDVTVRKADLQREIKSLISYAVGCWFGRYSLDVKGLAYAGGEWDNSKYKTIIPVKDNVLPICDDDYLATDLTGLIVEFVRIVYGEDTLEENMKFIADALGGKGTPREVIRNYLLTGFYADHCKIYQKRPIYWLFNAGKKHSFKALVYMHRWEKTTVATVRTDYVHELQERYRTQLSMLTQQMEQAVQSDRVKLKKQSEKLTVQLDEINKYEEKVHHLADMMIDIDLDDGVKVNYEKFADILEKIK